jgi:cellobiose-specific phosphotransferase system component IIC
VVCSIGLFLIYNSTKPTTPQPEQDRTYSSNNHGHVVYLTGTEQFRIYGLGGTGAVIVVVAAFFKGRRRKTIKARQFN